MNGEFKLLSELVAIDTNAATASNYEDMARLLKEKIESIGGSVELVYSKAQDKKPRPNVIGRINNGGDRTIALNAHYDVVGVSRRDWKSEPFTIKNIGDRLYGRGISDDKSGIALALEAVQKARSKANIELLFTCDEEVGSEHGLKYVMERCRGKVHANCALVLDVEDCLVIGCSGVSNGRIMIKGVEYHAGMPQYGRNAIEKSLVFLHKLKGFDEVVSRYHSQFAGEKGGKVKERFNITMINGGVSPNLIPGSVDVHFDMRSPPGVKVAKFHGMLKKYFEKVKKETKTDATLKIDSTHESYITDVNSDILKRMNNLVGHGNVHVSFGGFDGTFFSEADIPSIAYGAQNFSIHKANEYLEISTFRKVQRNIVKLLESY